MYERIRQAYFVEGKSKDWIAREYHHHWTTVDKVIRSAPAFPGSVIPERKRRQMEMYKEIRRLYFAEGKSTRQIAKESRHSLQTIARALHSASGSSLEKESFHHQDLWMKELASA